MNKRTGIELSGLLALILLTTLIGPAEKTLGSAARIIYLHGALVWVAIMVFGIAALLGLTSLLVRRAWLHEWTLAAGRVALVFWAGYLPISMWAAKVSWGRVFLEDPSFQRAFRILAAALIIQVLIWLFPQPRWATGALNLIPFAALIPQLYRSQQLMHPDSPIRDADSALIQFYFYFLSALCALLAAGIGRWMLSRRTARQAIARE
jgi:hypothetical protein